jgi:hypothetical protein
MHGKEQIYVRNNFVGFAQILYSFVVLNMVMDLRNDSLI